jgi:hypothetical protein
MEPANKYNNLSRNFKNRKDETEQLKKFAKITKERIQSGILNENFSVHAVFRPQPTAFLPNAFPTLPKPQILISVKDSFKGFHPDVNVRNEKIYEQGPLIRPFLRGTKIFLSSAVLSAAQSVTKDENYLKNVKEHIKRTMDVDFSGIAEREWTSSDKEHVDYDVTFTFPLDTKQEDETAVGAKISFKWN